MGRETKRVPLTFNWPVGKVWYGYMISACLEGEHGLTCDDCKNFAKIKGLKIDSCPVFSEREPPVGDGWQMWETTSEGSPISPVFSTPEELAKWLTDNNASSFGSMTATYEQWLSSIKIGWAPSAVLKDGKFMSGVEDASSL